jgi:hypothetical protein
MSAHGVAQSPRLFVGIANTPSEVLHERVWTSMVWGRMGLLDDAIREHLELRRLKGADPRDVARDESEALGLGNPKVGDQDDPGRTGTLPSEEEADAGPASDTTEPETHAHVGQETVELDMDSVLVAGTTPVAPTEADPRGESPAPVGHPNHVPLAEDSLEWEVPGDIDSSDEGDEVGGTGSDEGEIEDVLQETPDFLRDTPEQERLWFEQRPPRDFDFNE